MCCAFSDAWGIAGRYCWLAEEREKKRERKKNITPEMDRREAMEYIREKLECKSRILKRIRIILNQAAIKD